MGRTSANTLEPDEAETVPVSVRLPRGLVTRLDAWGQAYWRERWGEGCGPRRSRSAVILHILAEKLLAEPAVNAPAKARPRRKKTSRAA
jgi:hypothetical protein